MEAQRSPVTLGVTTIFRVGGPGGALFASGSKGAISANTRDWVTDGLLFYLQARGNTSPEGTLAVAKAIVPR